MADRIDAPNKTNGGIFLPSGYRSSDRLPARSTDLPALTSMIENVQSSEFGSSGYYYGLQLNRSGDYGICWSEKGSVHDGLICRAIATGEIGNVGTSPVIFAQLSAGIQRQMSQASTSSLTVTAKNQYAYDVRNAISWFDDSALGYTDAIQKIVFGLRTYNRGVLFSSIPVDHPQLWDDHGMNLRKIYGKKSEYWFDVDWTDRVPQPFLLDVLRFQATNDREWPFWYRTTVDGKAIDILLHRSQVVHITKGPISQWWLGTSAVYICLGFIGNYILAMDERLEKLSNLPTEGIIGISGTVQSAEAIKERITQGASVRGSMGKIHDKGWTILTSPNGTPIQFSRFSFRESTGIAYQEERMHNEDILAFALEEALTAIVTRGGVGYGSQAGAVGLNTADLGVNAILPVISVALGAMYPQAKFVITRISDAARRLNIETLETFSSAVSKLDPAVLSIEEQRAIIKRDIIDFTVVDQETNTVSATNDDDVTGDDISRSNSKTTREGEESLDALSLLLDAQKFNETI